MQIADVFNARYFQLIPAPPDTIKFKNPTDPAEEGQDFESGSVTLNLTSTDGFTDNITVSCEALDSRPKATVTWMLGILLSLFKCIFLHTMSKILRLLCVNH